MNKTDKLQFVTAVLDGMRDAILNRIKDGTVPEDWDGHELRAYIASKAEDDASISIIVKEPTRARSRHFRNNLKTIAKL